MPAMRRTIFMIGLPLLAAVAALPAGLHGQSTQLETRILYYQISELLGQQGDSALVRVAGGRDDGLHPGSRGTARVRWVSGDSTRGGDDYLGQAEVVTADRDSSTVVVRLARPDQPSGALREGDLVALGSRVPRPPRAGLLTDLLRLRIEFLGTSRQDLTPRRTILRLDSDSLERAVLDSMLANIKATAELLQDDYDSTSSLGVPLRAGRYRGRTVMRVMTEVTEPDLRAFLRFVRSYPGKYMGSTWRVDETFATWVLNDGPFGDDELRDTLLVSAPERRRQLLQQHTTQFRDAFAAAWNNTTATWSDAGRGEDATRLNQLVLEAAALLEDPSARAWGLFQRAQLEEKAARNDAALVTLREAAKLFEDTGEAQGASFSLSRIAGIETERGNYAVALAIHDSAIAAKRRLVAADDTGPLFASLGHSLFGRGNVLEKLGRWDASRAAFEEAVQVYGRSNTENGPTHQADARGRIAGILGKQGDHPRAIEIYRAILRFHQDLANPEGVADQYDNIGYHTSTLGRKAEAIALWDSAYTLHMQTGELGDAGYARSAAAQAWWNIGKYQEAIAAHQEAVSLRRRAGSRTGEAYSLGKLAGLYRDSGDPLRALAYYDSAAVVYRAAGDQSGEATLLKEQGDLYRTQVDYPRALASYRQSLTITRRIGATAETGAALHQVGDVHYFAERYDSATAAYTEALALQRQSGDRRAQVLSVASLGLAAEKLGRARSADSLYREASTILATLDDPGLSAWTAALLGRRFRARNQGDSALASYTRARELYRSVDDRQNEAEQELRLGEILADRGRFVEARARYDAALASATKDHRRTQQASALVGISWVELMIGNYGPALAAAEQSRTLSEAVKNAWGMGSAYNLMGNVLNSRGRYTEALGWYQRADSVFATINSASARSSPANNIGTIYFWQGDYARALPQFETAVRLLDAAGPEAVDPDARSTYVGNIGEVHYEEGRYPEAERALNEALGIAAAAGLVRLEASQLTVLAKVALAQGNLPLARQRLVSADSLARRAGLRSQLAEIATARGKAERTAGDLPAAGRSLTEAAAVARAVGSTKLLWEPLFELALVRKAEGDTTAALALLQESATVMEELRAQIAGGQAAQKLFASGQVQGRVYEELVALLVRHNEVDRALAVLEQSLNEELRSKFRGLDITFADRQKAELLAEEERRKVRLDGVTQQLTVARSAPDSARNTEQIQALERTRTVAEQEYLGFVNQMVRDQPDLKNHTRVNLRDLRTTKRDLPPDVALLSYLPGERELYIFAVTSDTLVAKVVPLPRDSLDRMVRLLVALARNPAASFATVQRIGAAGQAAASRPEGDVRQQAALLYQQLIAPVLGEIGSRKRLAIVPSGSLYYVPFQILAPTADSTSKPLGVDQTIFYVTELSVPAARRGPRPVMRLAAFGNADNTLPSAEREVLDLKRLYPSSTVFLRTEATEARAKLLPANFTVVHFATHGNLDYENFDNSFLTLAPGAGGAEDGKLTLKEVWSLNGFDKRQLVVLSACNTAVADEQVAGWPNSPATAFLDVGVPTVVASLWPVDDAATAVLITAFYRNLRTMDTAEALRQAQLTLRANPRFSHPYYWGAWVLVGDWR
jgi:CHAT domain-containing protein/tetratricopeptide (TPR) repeat protein